MEEDAPLARVLRALQKLDQVVDTDLHRSLLIEAETLLGQQLGLDCTGRPSGWNADGTVAYWSHDGDTCPIHEWLVPEDGLTTEEYA